MMNKQGCIQVFISSHFSLQIWFLYCPYSLQGKQREKDNEDYKSIFHLILIFIIIITTLFI